MFEGPEHVLHKKLQRIVGLINLGINSSYKTLINKFKLFIAPKTQYQCQSGIVVFAQVPEQL